MGRGEGNWHVVTIRPHPSLALRLRSFKVTSSGGKGVQPILVFLPPPSAHSCCLSCVAFRGLESNGASQGRPHLCRLGLRPIELRAPELVATPAGLVQLPLTPGHGEESLKHREAYLVPLSQVGTKEQSVSSRGLRISSDTAFNNYANV